MYYPLSQITTNLYTNGGDFQIKYTGEDYTGYYWKASDGKIFTGKTPQDTPIQELIIYIRPDNNSSFQSPHAVLATFNDDPFSTNILDVTILIPYTSLKNIPLDTNIELPSYSPIYPTSQDYQLGEMRRYFCKKINEVLYLEISKETYDKLVVKDPTIAYQYYIPFNIPWQITGTKEQTYKVNKNIVELTMKQQKLPMFDMYLKKDYTKYTA